MGGQKPRQGWIYMINPHRVCLRCQLGHTHIYDLNERLRYFLGIPEDSRDDWLANNASPELLVSVLP